MSTIKNISDELDKLNDKHHVDKKELRNFKKRIALDDKILKTENIIDHFCVFFLPIHEQSKSIFLGHHIKANFWIPPGGHIEPGEYPIDAVRREFLEELNFELTGEPIQLFDITKIEIEKRKEKCRVHWDLWYIVFIDKIKFKFDQREFYDVGWFPIVEAVIKGKQKEFNQVLRKVEEMLN